MGFYPVPKRIPIWLKRGVGEEDVIGFGNHVQFFVGGTERLKIGLHALRADGFIGGTLKDDNWAGHSLS